MSAIATEIELKWLDHGRGLKPPTLQTRAAAGADLEAAVPQDAPVLIVPGAKALVPCGFCLAIPHGFEAQIRPRSGLALKHGVTVLNAPGTIDADYRGEIMVILINHGQDGFTVYRGMRIAQMVVAPVTEVSYREVKNLGTTKRGADGFGSTG
ncbi:Deoxyuridine 5'-triphosphate nucleotidohydrolase [hydrothermal vent metagenome]|uniref:dUTP diphosphatase n=1 Tax=hydrothermal vent metagenome TaxID=652676 RepID=A0A3B0UAN6_9ZZZZ